MTAPDSSLPPVRLHDSASGVIRELAMRTPGHFSMYVCGPTVYSNPHLGHGRFLLEFDVLRRYLTSRGVVVQHVSNITDVDDKIIARAQSEGLSPQLVAAGGEAAWWDAVDSLGVARPTVAPHATDWVEQMVDLVAQLMSAGSAYRLPDGVYLDVSKVPGYGLLAHQSLDDMRAGARVTSVDGKRHPGDFALWKSAKPGEPSWPAPFGSGRPGWHTECVAMSLGLLGDGFDLHGGGADLAFPHHENERAQAVALGHRFAGHWMHNGFVTDPGGTKMGKSLGNAVDLPTFITSWDPRAYRVLTLRAQYRAPLVVDAEAVEEAATLLRRLDGFAARAGSLLSSPADTARVDAFHAAMSADLDTASAFALLLQAVRDANRSLDHGAGADAAPAAGFVSFAADTFGLTLTGATTAVVPSAVLGLVARRETARAEGRWADSDALREQIAQLGWEVRDRRGEPSELVPRS